MGENSDNINYNLMEPPIFSIPKKTSIPNYDNNRLTNIKNMVVKADSTKLEIKNNTQSMGLQQNPNSNQNPTQIPHQSLTKSVSQEPTKPQNLITTNDIMYIINMVGKLSTMFSLKESFLKVFGTEKILIMGVLAILRFWIKNKFPIVNKLVFKEKYASLLINYTHYTSSYYVSQNSEADACLYKAILHYTIVKNIKGIKYAINSAGLINNFDKNIEIKLNRHIFIDTKTIISSTATIYEVEMYSFTLSQKKVKSFLNKCAEYYKKFLLNSVNYSIGNPHQRYYNYLSYNQQTNSAIFEDLKFYSNKTFDNIFFDSKDMFLKKVNYFCNNRASYRELGIPYTLGIVFYGVPGTGKTSCIKGLANLTGRSIININLSRMKYYKELKAAFLDPKINNTEISPDKRIYVFEEFDFMIDVFKQRSKEQEERKQEKKQDIYDEYLSSLLQIPNKEITADSPITLDTLLNCIDGTQESNGHIICLTTNYIEKIDKALLRPGRFDCHVHLDNASPRTILQMINHFYNKNKDKVPMEKFIQHHDKVIDKISKYCYYNEKLVWSPAKITQVCLSYIDDENYLEKIQDYLQNNYSNEIKILEYF